MPKVKQLYDNVYDVIYRVKSGRCVVVHNVSAKTDKEAKAKIKKEMKASSTFDKIVMAIKMK